mgnify:CR=1 FL=1
MNCLCYQRDCQTFGRNITGRAPARKDVTIASRRHFLAPLHSCWRVGSRSCAGQLCRARLYQDQCPDNMCYPMKPKPILRNSLPSEESAGVRGDTAHPLRLDRGEGWVRCSIRRYPRHRMGERLRVRAANRIRLHVLRRRVDDERREKPFQHVAADRRTSARHGPCGSHLTMSISNRSMLRDLDSRSERPRSAKQTRRCWEHHPNP